MANLFCCLKKRQKQTQFLLLPGMRKTFFCLKNNWYNNKSTCKLRIMMNRFFVFFFSLFLLMLNGCKPDKGNPDSQPAALISVWALSPDAPKINVFVNGTNTATSLPFGNYTLYNLSTPGNTTLVAQTTSGQMLVDTNFTTTANHHYSLFLMDTFSSLKHVLIQDNIGTATDTLYLRFFNFSPDAPAVDIYCYSDSTNHKTLWKNRSINNDISNDSINQFVGSKLGTYNFYAIKSGSKDTLAKFINKSLTTGGYYTLFLQKKWRVPSTDSIGAFDTTLQLGVRLH